jgi:hypothetical protein
MNEEGMELVAALPLRYSSTLNSLKGRCHAIFDPGFFFTKQSSPRGPDSRTKAVSYIASNSPRYSYSDIAKSDPAVLMRPRV